MGNSFLVSVSFLITAPFRDTDLSLRCLRSIVASVPPRAAMTIAQIATFSLPLIPSSAPIIQTVYDERISGPHHLLLESPRSVRGCKSVYAFVRFQPFKEII